MSSTHSTPRPYFDEQGRTDAEIYLTDIYDGKIVASKHMRKLADIMLPRFHEEYHGIHYNPEKGIRVCRFVEDFTCFPEGEKMGQPFLLEQFQRSAIEIVYGFVDENERRSTRQALMLLARKNGKTSLLAALCLYHLTSDGDNSKGGEIYACATGESQARKCFGAADSMRRHSPHLAKRIQRGMVQKRGVSGLNYPKLDSSMVALSNSLGHLDGLSTSMCCYDEVGAATDNGALLDLIEESMSARPEPVTWLITTQNYVRNNVLDERITYSLGWLDGTIHDDTFIPFLYMLDSREEIYDESAWPKANPGLLCGIKDWDYLRNRVNLAKQSRSKMPSLLTKEFNLLSNSYAAFLDVEECINNEEFELDPNVMPYAVIGFDLASKGDLNAVVARMHIPGDERIYEIAKCWIPEESIKIESAKDFKERDQVPYHQWAADGWMQIVEGDRVNQFVIIEFLRELVEMGIYPYAIAYDQWHVDDYTERELKRLVGDSRVHAVPQTARVLSPLLRESKLDLRAKKVICPNPVLHWCRSNCAVREDNNSNLFPQKKSLDSRKRIDAYMAELFAMYCYQLHEEDFLAAVGE